ncbi:peptide-methionine (S)-S-oxide reductase MsrA [Helicobacter sp. 11S02596-1]|uniref:peptide-methionine (S)-S-oxide reductase MsrA n=1 Tax=Helicobacter sp. 11S02596-1 TaxID=1476194 RepID=UPI000BA6ED9B|nr:peptide-methionine (S)-S-oxide reductase MsrA [Helicobacter sp. 11S02596-1]PAF45013.1 peptide-methionine (S)-S-oxide reductase [Helicobacter sp. 11S02596-1]
MTKTIYLAGGCFWGVQGYFDLLDGVLKSSVGYANSEIANPSYELVCTGMSGAVEAIELVYDDEKISLEKIFEEFFSIIDPTLKNRQGNDTGTQYRTGIYADDDESLELAKAYIQTIQPRYKAPIQTEVKKLQNYYLAEDYHQKYLQKNPQGYCHIDLSQARKRG